MIRCNSYNPQSPSTYKTYNTTYILLLQIYYKILHFTQIVKLNYNNEISNQSKKYQKYFYEQSQKLKLIICIR